MSWINSYKPNEKQIQKEYQSYRGQLKSERERLTKSNKLTRKDYTKNE